HLLVSILYFFMCFFFHYFLLLLFLIFFFFMLRPPPISTLFPYTTLFRSRLNTRRKYEVQLQRLLDTYNPFTESACQAPYHPEMEDRKSTRLNSSHVKISYAVFCLKKKKKKKKKKKHKKKNKKNNQNINER